MRLTLEAPDTAGALRVRCSGQISQSRFAGVTDPLAELIGSDGLKRTVRLDLENVDYVDSSGIGWLVGSYRRCSEAGGQLVLCRVPPVVEQVLRFCGLEKLFPVDRDAF
jgi:stage II sporulation protein AA (anti-sigma F factor antagonist)